MKTKEEWVEEINGSITTLKNKGIHTYFNFHAEMTPEIRDALLIEFFKNKGYIGDISKCPLNRYDIIITWTN